MVVKTAVIVKSAWKNKKAGDVVEYRGEEYTIGVDAFAAVEAAVAAGRVSDLVIVDKKLTSPVDGKNIESAATDIFESVVGDEESKDGKTKTSTVKFTAAAGGTASMNNDSALTGFGKVTVTNSGGVFFGGKKDVSLTGKVDADGNFLLSVDVSASSSTSATGSLTVTGKSVSEMAGVTVDGIADSAGNAGKVIDVIGNIYTLVSGDDDYEAEPAASFANVTLQNAANDSALNGGSITEKATMKHSDTTETKRSEEYTYSYSGKTGSGTATLTDAGAGAILCYKNVWITNQDLAGDLQVGDVVVGNRNESYSLKKSYAKGESFSSDFSSSKVSSVAGALTATGREDHLVKTNDLDMLSSATLKNVRSSDPDKDEVYSWAESGKTTEKISAAQKGEDADFTYSNSTDDSRTAKGSLTADSSVLGKLEGLKTLTATNTQFKSANSMNSKKTTITNAVGFAANGITEDMSLADLDSTKSHTYETSTKTTTNAAGSATLINAGAQGGDLNGFKTLTIVQMDYEGASGFGNIIAGKKSESIFTKTSYDVAKSASYEHSKKTTCVAAGTLTVIGNAEDDKLPISGDVLNFKSMNLENAAVAGNIGMTDPSSYIDAKKVSVTAAQGSSNAITVATDQETFTTAVGSLTAKSSDLGALSYIKTISITDSKFASAEANNTKNIYSTSGTGFTDAKLVPDVKGLDIKAIKHTQPFTTREFTREENAVGGTSFKFAGKTIGENNNVFIHGYKSVSLENSNADEKGVLTAV
ncbi:MAG: hypothetical protein J5806_02140, partial [Lentisphaeria bacterium]|nr:hypothetical protein [Lentisphaeria bacterium]